MMPIPTSPNYMEDAPLLADFDNCIVCNRVVKKPRYMFWVHRGGNRVVTVEEGRKLNADGEEASDLGLRPAGANCLKKFPELLPYIIPPGAEI